MRTRLCFVSNSSSCSFCVFGYALSPDMFEGDIDHGGLIDVFGRPARPKNSHLQSTTHDCAGDELGYGKDFPAFIVGVSPEYMDNRDAKLQFMEKIKSLIENTIVAAGLNLKAPLGLPSFIEMGWDDR